MNEPLPPEPVHLPHYPQGIPLPSHPKQQKPLLKIIGRMLKPQGKPKMTKGKGLRGPSKGRIGKKRSNNNLFY